MLIQLIIYIITDNTAEANDNIQRGTYLMIHILQKRLFLFSRFCHFPAFNQLPFLLLTPFYILHDATNHFNIIVLVINNRISQGKPYRPTFFHKPDLYTLCSFLKDML